MYTHCGFQINADNIMATALTSKDLWDRIMGGITAIMKKVDDRKRTERLPDAVRDEG